MNLDRLFGLDLSGTAVPVLCALVALTVGVVIAGSFTLLWQADHRVRRLAGRAGQASRELGLVALWRLERAVRDDQALPAGGEIRLGQGGSSSSVVRKRDTIGEDP